MKKKWIALTAMALCGTSLLAACDEGVTFNAGVHLASTSLPEVYAKSTKLTQYDGYSVDDRSDVLVLFEKTEGLVDPTTTYAVYNLKEGKEIYKQADTDVLVDYEIEVRDDYFMVTTITSVQGEIVPEISKKEAAIYNTSGKKVISEVFEKDTLADYSFELYDFNNDGKTDYAQFGTKAYKHASGEFNFAFDFEDRQMSSFSGEFVNDTFIATTSTGAAVFDKNLLFSYSYKVPEYADLEALFVLDSGNFIVQYIYEVDSFSTKYDAVESGNKYNLETKLVTPSTGTVKDIPCNYLLSNATVFTKSKLTNMGFGGDFVMGNYVALLEDVDAFISADKMVDEFAFETLLGIKADGTIEEVKPVVKNQKMSIGSMIRVYDVYKVEDVAGQTYILDANGKVIKEMNAQKMGNYNGKNWIYNGKLFDKNFKEIAVPEGYEVEDLFYDSVILTKEVFEEDGTTLKQTDIYTWDCKNAPQYKATNKEDGSETFKEEWSVDIGYLQTKKTEDGEGGFNYTYAYYNYKGEQVISTTHTLSKVVESYEEMKMIVSGSEEQTDGSYKNVYYLVTK